MANHQRIVQHKEDEYRTRVYAVLPILKYITPGKTVWCPFDKADSNYVKVFSAFGIRVIFSHIESGQYFFRFEPKGYDLVISNPPYSLQEPILERLFGIGVPFALLINEADLFDSKTRFDLFASHPFEMMVFDCRIDYIKDSVPETKSRVPSKSIYLCSQLLPGAFAFERIAHTRHLTLDGIGKSPYLQ